MILPRLADVFLHFFCWQLGVFLVRMRLICFADAELCRGAAVSIFVQVAMAAN